MTENHQITVALLAPRLESQAALNRLALRLAELFCQEPDLWGVMPIVPLAGGYQITETDPPQRDGAGEPDEPASDDEPQPALPAESPEDDVLLRLGKRGVPITYRLIGGRKVACLYDQLPDAALEAVRAAFARCDRLHPAPRVLVLGGWSGELPAAILAEAPKSTVFCFGPHRDLDSLDIAVDDLHALQHRLGAKVVLALPDDPCELDAIVLGHRVDPDPQHLLTLQKHLAPGGLFLGIHGADVMREHGAQVDDSGVWAISGRKLAKALAPPKKAPQPQEPAVA